MQYVSNFDAFIEQQTIYEANQLTDEQLERFFDEVRKQPAKRAPVSGQVVELAFRFMEDTGLRITEMLHVKKKDIDFESRILTVTHPKSEQKCKCSTWEYANQIDVRKKKLKYADPNCPKCKGKGKWKKPQRTTITPRLVPDLQLYCEQLLDDDLLFPGSRQSYWNWGKAAGKLAGLNIFQQKDERVFKGVFNHLFRQLCSKRTTRDAKDDPFQEQLVDTKMRHHMDLRSIYNRPDINYLLAWEQRKYVRLAQKIDGLMNN